MHFVVKPSCRTTQYIVYLFFGRGSEKSDMQFIWSV